MEDKKPFNRLKNIDSNIISLSKGRIPPQAIDLEEAVLGAMLIDEKDILLKLYGNNFSFIAFLFGAPMALRGKTKRSIASL